MSITITKVKVNNRDADSGEAVLVPFDSPIITWDIQTTTPSIKQLSYEIRIAKNNINWGTTSFLSDVIKQPYARDRAQYWRLKNKLLQRGVVYYGQIRAKDTTEEESEWVKFSFITNRLPFITQASISPKNPSEKDDLQLSYSLSSGGAIVKTKWFKNGVHYAQFDNYQKISKDYMRYGDTWYVSVTPDDGLELGPTVVVPSVIVSKKPPVVDELQIFPLNPNVNDILEASYVVNDPNTGLLLLNDKSEINWYVNGQLVTQAENQKFVRFIFKPKDTVYFTVTPSDGIFFGNQVASKTVTIQDSGFVTTNVRVDGLTENLGINTVNPTIEWDVISPFDRASRFANIKIGTSPGSNNVFETVFESFDNKFTIPDNVIRRGIDYYVSVSASDTRDVFRNYETSKFRVAGNLWGTEVDNKKGWTIELSLGISSGSTGNAGETTDNDFQRISLADGSKFAEIRFFANSIHMFLGSSKVLKYSVDMSSPKNLIIVAKNSDIKLYVENLLALDGTGLFTEFASDRFIEIGGDKNSSAIGVFKRIAYNIDGDYSPGSSAYSNISLEKFIDFSGMGISDVVEHSGDILIAANPSNSSESGQIFKVIETEKAIVASTESIDPLSLRINDLTTSPDESILYIGHSKGSTYFDGYFIPKYDSSSQFAAGFDPKLDLWELTSTTPFSALSYIKEGLVIDTTIANRETSDFQGVTVSTVVPALNFISLFDTSFSYNFDVEVTSSSSLNIYLTGTSTLVYSTSLIDKNVSEIAVELKSLTSSDNYFFALIYDVIVLNQVETQAASRLLEVSKRSLFPTLELSGRYLVVDAYNPNPYGILSTGKWFYSHRRPGTAWFERVDNNTGWTLDFNLRIDSVEDSDTPANVNRPKGMGIYFNDGLVSENLWFMSQEIVFEGANKSFIYDTTELTDYRLIAKKTRLKLYGKKNSDQAFSLIAETALNTKATNQGNAGRPAVFTDSQGTIHAVWHDDGRGTNRRQIYYSSLSPSSAAWSEPELIISDSFSSSNPDISIDSLGTIYVVYETTRSDYTDIAVITKNAYGWSESYLLTSNLFDSFNPKIAIDSRNNVHVVWEDYRFAHSQIFYCRRNASNGQWESEMLGGKDVQVTQEPVGAKRPAIANSNLNVYVSWTAFKRDGSTSIKMAMYDGGTRQWLSSGQGGIDYSVSGITSTNADNSDLAIDLKGQILVVWNDIVGFNYQIFGRFISSRLVFAKDVSQLTQGFFDSKHPRVGVDTSNGDIYVVFEKEQEKIVSAYDPYSARASDVNFKSPSVYMLRWNAPYQIWESSNQNAPFGYSFSFDVEFDFGLPRQSFRPVIPDKFSGDIHILFESSIVSRANENILNNDLFTQIRDIVFDGTFEPVYSIDSHNTYGPGELRLDGSLNRKELRFGDFSDVVSGKMVVGNIRYYLSDAVEPFTINLVSSATTNMPNTEIFAVAANNNGDAWFGTSNGLIFYKKSTNQSYLLDSPNYNISNLAVYGISFDKKANMYLATSDGTYASSDHTYFFKLTGKLPAKPSSIDVDNTNNIYIGSSEGLSIINANNLMNALVVSKSNVQQTNRTIEVADADITSITVNQGLPTNSVNVVKVDANNVAWVGTDDGLVRYASGEISVITIANGLNSNKINDIAIRNTAIRYVATTAGINKMTGMSVSPLNFDNSSAPPSAAVQTGTGDIKTPVFNNTKAILWKDPNILWVASTYNIFQITFVEESFTTEKTQITKFTSADFTLTPVSTFRNDDLQIFKIVGMDNRDIPPNALFEVTLNGNKITRGFVFSPENKLLRFNYPLSESDVVKVRVRFDVEKLGDFSQNRAQKVAIGNKATRIKKLVSANGGIYVMTGGDINTLQINDQSVDLPFDKIILETKPPQGKIKLGTRRERSVFEVNINPLEDDPYSTFHSVSGVDKMIVSNFTNFTTDGSTPKTPTVFSRFLLHDVGDIFSSVTKEFTFSSGFGRKLLLYQPVNANPFMMAGTSKPANVYRYNSLTQLWTKIDTLDVIGGIANPNASVEFMIQFQGKVYVGTGSDTGSAKIWVMNADTLKFDLFRTLPSNTHAHCAVVFNNVLYIGGGGGSGGSLYSFDGTDTKQLFSGVSNAILSLTQSNRELYAGTGSEGRIYKLDPINKTQEIIDVNADRSVISINSAVVNGQGYIFAGYGSSGLIKRSKIPDSPFTHSFKTVPSAVSAISSIGGVLYAAVGNTVYALENVWNAKYVHREVITDISVGPNNTVWFISDSYIYQIAPVENVKKVYLKLISKAGNETNLYLDAARTNLDPNLYDQITISDLANFINKNRIIKVDEFGTATSIREGNDRFYSADIVDQEIGEYYSEIFNGTNNLVSWSKISWDAAIPNNTSVIFYIRTGSTMDELLNAEFSFSVNGSDENADISFLSGQYIQYKVVMSSQVRGLSPALRNVVIKSVSSDSTHFFTTNFVMPSRIKSGILTSTKLIPVAADIVFGINTNNSSNFAEYQIVDENRIFTTEDSQIGSGMRIGIRFITPTKSAAATIPDAYGPYNIPVQLNATEWEYENPDATESVFNFTVNFYEDREMNFLVYSSDSSKSPIGFSAEGEIFPTGGFTFEANQRKSFSFTPVGETPLKCNTYYYVKIEAKSDIGSFPVSDDLAFIESCGTTFVDNINFDFMNSEAVNDNFHFRIRFYNNPERTDLRYTAFSGNDLTNWTVNELPVPISGFQVMSDETVSVNYKPDLSNIDAGTIYYLSIDIFDGVSFENNSNSFTFKANDLSSQIYCGSFADVPVVKNFSVMVELENNEFANLKVIL